MRFVAEVNRFTQATVLDFAKPGHTIRPQDVLLSLVWNFEAKEIYTVLRNIVSILCNRRVAPFPWIASSEFTVRKDKSVSIHTSQILNQLSLDLNATGFKTLANELKYTHGESVKPIRHAIAHGTFLAPCEATNDEWIFAEYRSESPGLVTVVDTRLNKIAFEAICTRFLNFRLAFACAVGAEKTRLDNESLEFLGTNQLDPASTLSCSLHNGQLRVHPVTKSLW